MADLMQEQNTPAPQGGGNTAPAPAGADMAQAQAWQAGFTKDLKGHKAFEGMGNMSALGSAYVNLLEKSQRMIQMPSDESSEDERKAYYKAMGIPDSPDGYEDDDYPDGFKPDAEALKRYRAMMHSLGLNKKQYKGLVGSTLQQAMQARQAREAAEKERISASDKALREEWKDQYDTNRELAVRGFKEFAGEEELAELTRSGLINAPWFIRFMHKAGQSIGEGRFIRGGAAPARPATMIDYNQGA